MATGRTGLGGFGSICSSRGIVTTLATLSVRPAFAAAPSNDDVTDAVSVPGVTYTNTVDTSEATLAATDPGCGPLRSGMSSPPRLMPLICSPRAGVITTPCLQYSKVALEA